MQKKILVVDNDMHMREMLYDWFSKKGYKVFTASDGEAAIETVKNEKPDLVLMDIMMPKPDGIEILKKIREFDAQIKIIMLTGMDNINLERYARLNGASGFLRKQLDLPLIAKAVDEVLAQDQEFSKRREKKILIADDNPQICALLEKFLIKKGMNPITASSGEEALEKVKAEKPAIVLLDVKMPGMDGLLTLKRIKEIDESIGVIMITGAEDESIANEAMKSGAYDYIIKPIDLDRLEVCLLTKILLLSS